MKSFLDTLRERVVLFDGAMGTEIYNRGVFINRCYDEMSLVNPDMVREIHASYLSAGAEVLTSNTFGANRIRLSAFGLADKTVELNVAGVQLAREVAGDKAWVAGSMGPVGNQLAPVGKVSPGEAFQAAREQATILAENGADFIILETFDNLAELWHAVRGVRAATELPIVASVTFRSEGLTHVQMGGLSPAAVAERLSTWPIQAMGVNCALGPRGILDVVESLVQLTDLPIIAQPNAGYPQIVDGRTIFLTGSEYMAEYARRLAQKGARGVGGCCGTTPAMIKEMRVFLRSISPAHQGPAPAVTATKTTADGETPCETPTPPEQRSEFARRIASGKFCVSVELDPPRGINPHRAVEGAALLYRAGVDVVNIADGPRAVARMGPTALSQLVRSRVPPMETVVHYCCRDRNLLGMQMDLLGAHALGLRNILAVTGDPPKMGTYPDATAVFDIDSIGLISFIQLLNRGLDFSGQPIGGKTELFVGTGCNPGAVDMGLESERFLRKVDAGAEYTFSQPLFDDSLLERFLDRTASASDVPFFVGIMPLVSVRNAEFLHNEVPGMQIPDAVMNAMRAAGTRDQQREVGLQVAREALLACKAHPRIRGVYVYPPFGSYRAVLRLLDGILEPPPDADEIPPPRFQKRAPKK